MLTVKEVRKLIKKSYGDSIVYKRNNKEVVDPKDTDTVVGISATGGYDGQVYYIVELG